MSRHKSLPSPTGMWAMTAHNGRRYHAFTTWDVYEYVTACGIGTADVYLATGEEPPTKK